MTNLIDIKEWKKLEIDRLNKEFEENIVKLIPPRFRLVKDEDIPENILNVFKKIDETKRGIYMFGSCGIGKTHIAYGLLRYRLRNKLEKAIKFLEDFNEEEEIKKCENIVYYHRPHIGIYAQMGIYNFTKVLRDIKDTMEAKEGQKVLIEDYDEPITVLDDVGAEKFTEWSIETLYHFINERYERMKPTIIIGNLSLKELAEKIGDRIPSRIAGMCEVIKLEGKDRRF